MCCSADSKIPFLPFFPLFYGELMQPTKKIRPHSSSATQNQHEKMFSFSFYANVHVNGRFSHFPLFGHIELNELTENVQIRFFGTIVFIVSW